MKNKLILLLCAAVIMMLCACDSGNVNNASADKDVVTVSFAVAQEGAPDKIISIDSPLNGSNVLYQYKAIASFTSADGKAPKGSTGDVWTNFPSVSNGSNIELTFARGSWTLDVRGILKGDNYANDKNDYSLLYQTSAPMKVALTANTTQIIVFNVEKTKDGIGFADVNIIAQGDVEMANPPMVVTFKSIAEGKTKELSFKGPTGIDKYIGIYTAENFELASGIYLMTINFNNEETEFGPYVVEIVEKKKTSVEGKIATDFPYGTYFEAKTDNRLDGRLDCAAYFERTIFDLEKHEGVELGLRSSYNVPREAPTYLSPFQLAQKEQLISKELKAEAVKLDAVKLEDAKSLKAKAIELDLSKVKSIKFDAVKQVATPAQAEVKQLNQEEQQAELKQVEEKQAEFKQVEFKQVAEKQEEKQAEEKQVEVKQRVIILTYNFICDGVLVEDPIAGSYDKKTNRWNCVLPAKLFNDKLTDHSLVIRATAVVDKKLTFVAESDPVAISFK